MNGLNIFIAKLLGYHVEYEPLEGFGGPYWIGYVKDERGFGNLLVDAVDDVSAWNIWLTKLKKDWAGNLNDAVALPISTAAWRELRITAEGKAIARIETPIVSRADAAMPEWCEGDTAALAMCNAWIEYRKRVDGIAKGVFDNLQY